MKIKLLLSALAIFLVSMVGIVAAEGEDERYWLENGVIPGEHLAGPVILDFKYVDGEDFVVKEDYCLVQPYHGQDIFYVFVVGDAEDNIYMAFATEGISFLNMYQSDCSRLIQPCGDEFIKDKIGPEENSEEAWDDYRNVVLPDLLEDFHRVSDRMISKANGEGRTLFVQTHDGMNPRSKESGYVTLYRLSVDDIR